MDWPGYRDMRSKTSHSYDEDIATVSGGWDPKFFSRSAVSGDWFSTAVIR